MSSDPTVAEFFGLDKSNVADPDDSRDSIYRPALLNLPSRMLPYCLLKGTGSSLLPARHQGDKPQCTGYALASLIDMQRLPMPPADGQIDYRRSPSPVSAGMLFAMGQRISAKTGGGKNAAYSIRSAIKGFYHNGVCSEQSWDKDVPPDETDQKMVECNKEARKISLGAYFRLMPRLADYHSALGEVGAILVSARLHPGWVPERVREQGRIVLDQSMGDHGAHAFVIVGYDEVGFFVRNSWGRTWAGTVGGNAAIEGIAHWSYKDWAQSVIDAWVLRLAVSTPSAFEFTQGLQGTAYFGSVNAGVPGSAAARIASESVSVSRQLVLGHYVHVESGRYVRIGNYPDSPESLVRTMNHIRHKIGATGKAKQISPPGTKSTGVPIERIYLRIAGDTGAVDDAMNRVAVLRRMLRPMKIYPISIIWTARMASAFAIGIRACMEDAITRMPKASQSRDELIESLIRPLGRPLWQQLKHEAASLVSFESVHPGAVISSSEKETSMWYPGTPKYSDGPGKRRRLHYPGPLVHTLMSLNKIYKEQPDTQRPIELVFEGASAHVFIQLILASPETIVDLLKRVNHVYLAFPVGDHATLIDALTILNDCSQDPEDKLRYEALMQRLIIIRPNKDFLARSRIGPYTKSWFHLVNNSFERIPEPAETDLDAKVNPTRQRQSDIQSVEKLQEQRNRLEAKSRLLAISLISEGDRDDDDDPTEIQALKKHCIDKYVALDMPRGNHRWMGLDDVPQEDASATLRNRVVSDRFIQAVLDPAPVDKYAPFEEREFRARDKSETESMDRSSDQGKRIAAIDVATTATKEPVHDVAPKTRAEGSRTQRSSDNFKQSNGDRIMSNKSKGYSLHIGINTIDKAHYGSDGALMGCEADATAMHEIATAAGYINPRMLLTQEAMRQEVIESIEKIAEKMTADDIFFLSYAGHGSQVPDINKALGDDNEEDGTDETFLLYDGQLLDDELAELWKQFPKGSRILMVSDSCHSQNAARQPLIDPKPRLDQTAANADANEPRSRFFPPARSVATLKANKEYYIDVYDKLQARFVQKPIEAGLLLLAGCANDQVSMDGPFNGAFTTQLLQVWDDGNFTGSYIDLLQEIRQRMPNTQNPFLTAVGADIVGFNKQSPFAIEVSADQPATS